jgi:hypothetical protein
LAEIDTQHEWKGHKSVTKLFEESNEEIEHKECVNKKVIVKIMVFVSQNLLMQNLNSVERGCNAKERENNES